MNTTDKEKLEQYEFIDEQIANLVASIRKDGDFYIYNSHTVVSEILDWHEEQVAEERERLGEILRQELEPNMAKYIIGRLEQSQEDTHA